VVPEDLTAEITTQAGELALWIGVTLPAGAYATSLLREIMKVPQPMNME